MSQGRILIVDDDQFFRNLYSEMLDSEGYHVVTAASGKEAVACVSAEKFDLVITDLMMPDMNGQEVLEKTKQHNAMTDVILITGHATIESAISALKSGAFDYLRKPVNHDELILSVKRCIEQKRLLEENKGLKRSIKLLEVSRTVSTCIDKEKLYEHVLDAVIQEVPSRGGMCLFYDDALEESPLEIKAVRQLDESTAGKAGEGLIRWLVSNERLRETIAPFNIAVLGSEAGFMIGIKSFLLVPVKSGGKLAGFVVTFSHLDEGGYSLIDIDNARFIADQSTLSFENIRKYSTAQDMAYLDSLTDLYNTRFLEVALDREVKRSRRSGIPFSVLFLDLDHFKQVNDVHGHLVGSKVLIEVGNILSECVREVDTVVRYGGDEFTIILVDTDANTGFKIAERIRKTIESNAFLTSDGVRLKVTSSIGLASFPIHASDRKSLIDMADKAMYYGKNRSRNTVYMAQASSDDGSGS